MDLRTIARWSGLVGGLCWLVRFVLDLNGSGSGAAPDAVYWVGLVLLGVALLTMGMGLVSKSALWLRAIVGVAFPLLVWSVLEVLHPAGNPRGVDGVFGLLVALVAVVALVRSRSRSRARSPREEHPRSAGVHTR